MSNKRRTDLKKLNKSIKEFKKQNPKVDEAIRLYNANSEARGRVVAQRYRTTTSTSPNSMFTTR